ncbi:MAG: IS630 family transposase [Deltaproteobacteria bacterium]|nr:IS630 family transposase [Deltaproteobacteria bacterium]
MGRVKRDSHIQTNRTKSWCVSKDPQLPSKSVDVITQYLNTEPNVVVVSVDEMTGVQALERTLGLIVVRGSLFFGISCRYRRHSTINLFSGLEVKSGIVYGKICANKKRVDFIDFMDQMVEEIPGANDPDSGIEVRVILDNYCIHKGCDAWLAEHPNITFHFTPTCASWMNGVETFFGKLKRFVLKGGSFPNIDALKEAINGYIDFVNINPVPYKWRKRDVRGAQLLNVIRNFM